MAAPPRRRDSPPVLPDEIVEEILLRLPPDEPAPLLRVSLVCKSWATIVSSPWFRRRLHEFHRTPRCSASCTTGTTKESPASSPPPPRPSPSPPRIAATGRPSTAATAAPYSCPRARMPMNSSCGSQSRAPNAAYRCRWPRRAAAYWRQPRPCSAQLTGATTEETPKGGPFHLLFVFTEYTYDDDYVNSVTSACLYSSETAAWGELTSIHSDFDIDFSFSSGVLVGRSLCYFLSDTALIVEYDLARHTLTVLDPPPPASQYCDDTLSLMVAEDGGLGLSQTLDQHLKLWSRKASSGTDAEWVLSRVIYLENLLPNGALVNQTRPLDVLGFAEGANVLFVTTVIGLLTVELESERMRKVYDNHGFCNLIPFVGFYTPVPCGKHQGSPKVPYHEKVALEGVAR